MIKKSSRKLYYKTWQVRAYLDGQLSIDRVFTDYFDAMRLVSELSFTRKYQYISIMFDEDFI